MTDVLHRLAFSVFGRQDVIESFDHESGESVDAAMLDRAECRLSTSLGMVVPALHEARPSADAHRSLAGSVHAR
jgi:hypothetical protein